MKENEHHFDKHTTGDMVTSKKLQAFDRLFYISAKYKRYIYICPISVTRVKCGIRSTLCWKIGNISGSTDIFGL